MVTSCAKLEPEMLVQIKAYKESLKAGERNLLVLFKTIVYMLTQYNIN